MYLTLLYCMLENLIIKSPSSLNAYGSALNYNKIVGLSESDLSTFYLELMNEYEVKSGWWTGKKIPKCNECSTVISGPGALRRYKGISMHPECFKKYYSKNGDDEGIMKDYWLRIANLPDLTKKP